MNRKANPWVSLAALALLAVILVAVCSGCEPVEASTGTTETTTAAETYTAARFKTGHYQIIPGTIRDLGVEYRIITDTATGVQYLLITNDYGVGLTVLQPGTAETEEANQ